jgi:putative ABC transport system permease protein
VLGIVHHRDHGVGAVFGAQNTMYAAIGARTREIATLLVLGFGPFSILSRSCSSRCSWR